MKPLYLLPLLFAALPLARSQAPLDAHGKPLAEREHAPPKPGQRAVNASVLAERIRELNIGAGHQTGTHETAAAALDRLERPLTLAPATGARVGELADVPGHEYPGDPAIAHVDRAADVDVGQLLGLPAAEAAAQQIEATALPELRDPSSALELDRETVDAFGTRHLRMRQYHRDVPVYGAELILHQPLGQRPTATGQLHRSLSEPEAAPALSDDEAIAASRAALGAGREQDAGYAQSPLAAHLAAGHHDEARLYYVRSEGAYRLTYVTETSPSLGEHYVSFVDALTGEVYDRYSEKCTFLGELPPGTATARDLNGADRALQVYQEGGGYYLIDGTRASFARDGAIPGGERGALVTGNARGTSPQNDDFSAVYASSVDNRWSDAAEVSAHYNTARSYEYFERTFGRNSLDGNGGTVTAFVNTSDQDGSDLDNAFYVNGLMFYGVGAGLASNWAGSLDVGAHEMSHGVVDFSANLEYRGESGALNEHFADIFAVMVDRDDWTVGEEIVNRGAFRSGAIRDFADPRNGGTSLSDLGYQPPHYDERYVGEADYGGVHINSGIPNHAAYLTAEAIGREKTEQIWYSALTNYLTRTSQFIDFRGAIQQATEQAYGRGTEYDAVVRALDAVGIPGGRDTGGGTGGGGTTQETNPGTQLIAMADGGGGAVELYDLSGNTVIGNLTPGARPASKISVSDDGSLALVATDDGDINVVSIDYGTNTVTNSLADGDLDEDGLGDVRNVALSRDGALVALLTDDYDATVYVLDLALGESQAFPLYTTGSNGERLETVEYADVMEWDYTGTYLILDMLNTVGDAFGLSRSYWEIAALRAHDGQGFADGGVQQLFGSLDPGVSIGNPTLAKNNEVILAYDYWAGDDTYETRAVNLLTGEGNTLWSNDRLGWPTFTADDRYLLFEGSSGSRDAVGFLELGDDKISNPTGSANVFQYDRQRANAFANGSRTIVSAIAAIVDGAAWVAGPNPTADEVHIFRNADAPRSEDDFELLDLSGRRVLSAPHDATAIDVGDLRAGAYVLRQGWHTQRIVKQ